MSGIGARRAWAKARQEGFEAHFQSICRKCPELIQPGDHIVPVTGGGFAHIDCTNRCDRCGRDLGANQGGLCNGCAETYEAETSA